ncbi:hypothetical protein H4R35_000154 [Dimargaris xerosporica]|nr:hypothetical protein H4R35_000154 [Dimargaris xerosporica]
MVGLAWYASYSSLTLLVLSSILDLTPAAPLPSQHPNASVSAVAGDSMEGSSQIAPGAEGTTAPTESAELDHQQLNRILDDSLPNKSVLSGLFRASELQSWAANLLARLADIQKDPSNSSHTLTAAAAYTHALAEFHHSLTRREFTAEPIGWMWQDFLNHLWNEHAAAERDPVTAVDGPASLAIYEALYAAQEQTMNQRENIMQACADIGSIVDGWANLTSEDKRALVDQFLESKLISPVSHRDVWVSEEPDSYPADDQWDWAADDANNVRSVGRPLTPLSGRSHNDGSTVYFDVEEDPWVESDLDDAWMGSNAGSSWSMAMYARDRAEGILSAIPPNSWDMTEGDVNMLSIRGHSD